MRFITERGEERTLKMPEYSIMAIGLRQVLATGTTATGIHVFVI